MSGRRKLFVAEDSRMARSYRNLFSAEYDVVIAETGREAWELIAQHGPFDISIIDIVMPVEVPNENCERTGLRLINHMLETKMGKRFVVLTARHDIGGDILTTVGGRGVYSYLLKAEVDERSLRSAVSDLMQDAHGELQEPSSGWLRNIKDEMESLVDKLNGLLPAADEIEAHLRALELLLKQVNSADTRKPDMEQVLVDLTLIISRQIIWKKAGGTPIVMLAKDLRASIDVLMQKVST